MTSPYRFTKTALKMQPTLVEIPATSAAASVLEFAIVGDDLVFMSPLSNDIFTAKSCSATSIFVKRGEDDFTDRVCVPCPPKSPYSGGFASQTCQSCESLQTSFPFAFGHLCAQFEPEKPEPEPEEPIQPEDGEIEVEKDPRPEPIFGQLPPLKEKEFDFTPYLTFLVIVVPFILLYCIIVCIFRARRAKRKAAEMEERR